MLKYVIGTIAFIMISFICFRLYFFSDGKKPVYNQNNFKTINPLQRNTSSDHFTMQSVRHATLLVSTAKKIILVDPMLSDPGSMPPVQLSFNRTRNPLVPLPFISKELLNVDAILVTHTHWDHFDDIAKIILPKNIPLFCQPVDVQNIKASGFTNVIPVHSAYTWGEITITRTAGKHGTGSIEKKMGPVSGFVLSTGPNNSLYITGDSIYNSEVQNVVNSFKPTYIIAYSGAAQMIWGSPITMDANDILTLSLYAKQSKIIAVHMEAVNHCALTRNKLRSFINNKGTAGQVIIPSDGDILKLQ